MELLNILMDVNIIDFILHINVHLQQLINDHGQWIYLILFLIVFCETGLVVTPFLPGDSLLFVGGALCAMPQNHLSPWLFALVMIAAAILGDTSNYYIGKFFGEKLFSNPHSKIFKQEYLEKTHNFYKKHGGKTIILARFVPIVRTFAPFVAGMGKMTYHHFEIFNATGAVLWVGLFTGAGHFFGTMPFVQKNLEILMLAIIIISLVPMAVEYYRNKKAGKSEVK